MGTAPSPLVAHVAQTACADLRSGSLTSPTLCPYIFLFNHLRKILLVIKQFFSLIKNLSLTSIAKLVV